MRHQKRLLEKLTFNQKNFGGAAMEYIIVSTFAAVISLVAIGFVAKVFQSRMSAMAEKLGIEADFEDLNPFLK